MAQAKKEYKRFSLSQRILHVVLFSSVFTLAVTGLPRKYHDTWWAQPMVDFFRGLDNMALLHRIAAIVLILVCVIHLFYHVGWKHGFSVKRIWNNPMVVRAKDFTEFFQYMKYLLKLSNDFPKMGRFTWFEKFDYWGAFWGVVIMISTGAVMWKFDIALQYIPLGLLEAIWVVHGDEATLAIAFLVLIHMYNVHINPRIFPMTMTWLHGKVSEEEMKKYHPLELEELEKAGKAEERIATKASLVGLQKILDKINARYADVVSVGFVIAGIVIYIYIMRYFLFEALHIF